MTIELIELVIGVGVLLVVLGPFRIDLFVVDIGGSLLEVPLKKGGETLQAGFLLDSGLIERMLVLRRQFFLFPDIDLVFIGDGVLCDALALAGRASRSRCLIGLFARGTLLWSNRARGSRHRRDIAITNVLPDFVETFLESTRCWPVILVLDG